MEDSGSDLVAAGFDINAQGHKQVAPPMEIGLEPGQMSLGTPSWNLPPGFLRVDGKCHFKFEIALEWIGPFPQRPTRKLAMRCAPANRVPARRGCHSKGLSPTIKGIFMKVDLSAL